MNKGRVPFIGRKRRNGESRAWGAVLDRMLRRPLVSLSWPARCCSRWPCPVLDIHTADSGIDGLPRSLPIMKTYDRMQAAFPGETFSADIVVEAGTSTRLRCATRRSGCTRSRASPTSSRSP